MVALGLWKTTRQTSSQIVASEENTSRHCCHFACPNTTALPLLPDAPLRQLHFGIISVFVCWLPVHEHNRVAIILAFFCRPIQMASGSIGSQIGQALDEAITEIHSIRDELSAKLQRLTDWAEGTLATQADIQTRVKSLEDVVKTLGASEA